jgi:dTDP-4-dehydrorhamnose reductase
VDQHHIAGADLKILALKSTLKVRRCNLVTWPELCDTFVSSHVDEQAASNQRADVFDAQFGQPFGLSEVASVIAVIKEVADAEMA